VATGVGAGCGAGEFVTMIGASSMEWERTGAERTGTDGAGAEATGAGGALAGRGGLGFGNAAAPPGGG
ncbi:hypothetical protein ABTJ13_19330, partial [Acinetobacter baumannii]